MRIKQLLIGITASVIAISSYVEIAVADLKFPMLVYRTGAYAPNGIPNADGFVDYYKMINARDGGIGGEKILHPGVIFFHHQFHHLWRLSFCNNLQNRQRLEYH